MKIRTHKIALRILFFFAVFHFFSCVLPASNEMREGKKNKTLPRLWRLGMCVLYESDSMAIESTQRIMDDEIKRESKKKKKRYKNFTQTNKCTSCAPLPSSQRNIYLFRFGINGIDILHYYYYYSVCGRGGRDITFGANMDGMNISICV